MRLLVLPPSDYLANPNPCRIHNVFEQFKDFGDEVYTMRFHLRDEILRTSSTTVFNLNDYKSNSIAMYYLLNSGVFAKSAGDIIRKYDIDAVIYSNLLPPYVVSKIVPKSLLSVVDLVDHYPAVALENTPGIVPKPFANLIYSNIMKSVLRNSDSIVACSYTLARYAEENGAKDVHRIPNGVKKYFFSDYSKDAASIRKKIGASDSDLVMCFVGNVEYWLKMEDVIDAIYQVKKRTQRRIKFMIIGSKLTTNYFNQIQERIKSLNLTENVINVGFVDHNSVPKYVAASDLCVSPKDINDPVSLYSAPVKVWEYLAQGKPVISTPVPEVVVDAKDCVAIANSPAEYTKTILSFLDQPSELLEKANKGQEVARQHSWERIAKDYRQLLAELLKKHQP